MSPSDQGPKPVRRHAKPTLPAGILPGFLARRLQTDFLVALRSDDNNLEFVSCADIMAFNVRSKKTSAILIDRTVQTHRPWSWLRPFLKKHGNWFAIGRGIYINANRLVRSQRDRKGGFQLTIEGGAVFNLLAAYAPPILKFLETKSLLQVDPIAKTHALLMEMGLRDLDKDIRTMTADEVAKHFSTASGSAIVLSDLILNFLWQQIVLIRAGHDSPADGGNLRTLWYEIKHVIQSLPNIGPGNPYKVISQQLALMVKNHVCSYKEFNFYDDGKWTIGAYNPHVILMAEKEAHYGMFLKHMQDLTGVSIIATGGQPSGITSEYFCSEFRRIMSNLPDHPPPVVLALVDYDPFGWALQQTFMQDLATFGVKVPSPPIHLVLPAHFTPLELAEKATDLTQDGKTPPAMLRKWLKVTNGIDGRPFAMEAGQFIKIRDRARDIFLRLVDPFLIVPAPVPKRFWEEEAKRHQSLQIHGLAAFTRCMVARRLQKDSGQKPRGK